MNVGAVEPLQLPGFSLRQQGARFIFTDTSPIVPPEPNLNNLYDAVGRNISKKFLKNTNIGHTAACSVAPPTTGFSDQMLDPVLHDTNRAKFQLTGVHSGTDGEDREDDGDDDDYDDDNEDNGDNTNDRDEENIDPEDWLGGGWWMLP
jgi:hypothetical protein